MSKLDEAAVRKLDPNNDSHWTTAGLPSLAALKEANGGSTPSRSEVNAAAPNFDREAARGGSKPVAGPGQNPNINDSEAKPPAGSPPGADRGETLGVQNEAAMDRSKEQQPEGEKQETPADIAGENIPGDPSLNNRGGLQERPMESTADRDVRAAAQSMATAAELVQKMPSTEDPFELMDKFSSITAGPQYRRNQTFAQIRTLWASQAAGSRQVQERIDKRFERAASR